MTSLVRWDPWTDLATLRSRMDRLFDELLGWGRETGLSLRPWTPVANVRETATEYTVTLELPGMRLEDIRVEFRDGRLVVEGERKFEDEEHRDEYHRIERAYGRFCRTFDFNTPVDMDKVEATYKDGILTIRLPKVEEAQPKSIPVKAA
jgi:HSP20 family protein